MRLKDQVAVVTGGGGGLGEGICLCLAREGAHVVVSDVKQELAESVAKKIEEMGVKSLVVQTDVRMADQCESLIGTAISELGGLDILVCCAGVGRDPSRPIDSNTALGVENLTESDWDVTIDVNLKGVFLCNKAAVPHFKAQKKGKIVNISSVAGRQGTDALMAYAASKAGVISLSQSMALHMAQYGVNVNTVCPGIIWTPMWADGVEVFSKTHPLFKGADPQQIFDTMVQTQIPMQRAQTPEDMGNAVVFLVSDEAREITGQALNVCGGMKMN
jgi:meso-butanediol dehydrogenase / (S,S)-butanediol dehydrogenase / diacetyl reductase